MKRKPIFEQLEMFQGIDSLEKEFHEMRRVFGPGPEGKTCRTCVYLRRKILSKTYLKCAFRIHTSGPGTDHRASWLACAKYEEVTKK